MTLNETIICMINMIDLILADNIISMVNISDFSAWTLHSFTFIYVTKKKSKYLMGPSDFFSYLWIKKKILPVYRIPNMSPAPKYRKCLIPNRWFILLSSEHARLR